MLLSIAELFIMDARLHKASEPLAQMVFLNGGPSADESSKHPLVHSESEIPRSDAGVGVGYVEGCWGFPYYLKIKNVIAMFMCILRFYWHIYVFYVQNVHCAFLVFYISFPICIFRKYRYNGFWKFPKIDVKGANIIFPIKGFCSFLIV